MFVTTLDFDQVLEQFYEQNEYEFLLLFVSSFDGKDKNILEHIVANAKRIDKITGERICFFYFIQDLYDSMNEKLTRWVRKITDYRPLYGEGVSVTMDTSDDICSRFGLLRSELPAFILINKNRLAEPQLMPIKNYDDFESFLTPLNILHRYDEDKRNILSDYEFQKRSVITEETVVNRKKQRLSWSGTLRSLERKREKALSMNMDVSAHDSEILKLKEKLDNYPELGLQDVEGCVTYPNEKLQHVKTIAVDNLNMSLNSGCGEWLVEQMQDSKGYSDVLLKIWDLVRTRGVRISRVVENIRREIYERGFDVFISCKSQDYAKAYSVYEYLKANGHNPFLADHTLKEIGVDQYTAVIGEVINVCQNMVVFTTNVDYLDTPYVHAEWNSFVNDINTGHKPNALLVNLLSPDIDIHTLPAWLRDKQFFTTENYREGLLDYLNNRNNLIIRELKETIEDTYRNIRDGICRWKSARNRNLIDEYLHKIEWDKNRMFNMLEAYKHDLYVLKRIQKQVEHELRRWEDEYYALEKKCSGIIEIISYGIISEHSSSISSTKRRYMPSSECGQDKEFVNKPSVSFFPSFKLLTNLTAGGGGISLPIIKLFGRKTYDVYSSIFAPAEVKRNSRMLVQVYLHLLEETEKVKSLAKESQKDAQRRDYIPLQCKLRKGDKVDILLNVYGESLLMSDKKSMEWKGSFTKCAFDFFVPNNIEVDQLSCKAFFTVNGVPVGEMSFITEIVVDTPRNLNTEIKAHNYRKVFISYAHKDEPNVKFLAKGLDLSGIDYFFDRKYLKAGDIYPQVIKDYINSADLFVLCWSANASQSEYVKKEYTQALGRVNPQVKSQKDANLSIYPISIEPRAELPDAMKDNYHFGEV